MSGNFWIEKAEEFLYFEHPSERDVLHPHIIDKINAFQPKTYLDFGAGDGRMTAKIHNSIPIDIYDISQKMIVSAKRVLGERLKNIYTEIPAIPLNHYDVIVCSMVMVCINEATEYKRVLKSIAASLSVKGKAIFSVTHPCFRKSAFSDFYTEYTEGKEFDYFNEGKPFDVTIHDPEKVNRVTFEDYHWSLSFTINNMIGAGLKIVEIIETTDDKKMPQYNKVASPFIIIITEKNEK